MLKERFKLSEIAQKGLQKIRRNQQKKALQEIMENNLPKVDYSKYVFEEYSDDYYKQKVSVDKYIYNVFFEALNPEQTQDIAKLLGDMLRTTRQIYEGINIKPKKFGFQKLNLDSSETELLSEARSLIKDYLNTKYYSLTKENKEKAYKSDVISLAKDLVMTENLDVDESISHSYKTVVVNKFIKKLNFPYVIECKINELFSSKTYDELYEKDKLKDLWSLFEQQSLNISRIIALTI